MDLRPDIADAAARLASGFDVSRELRQLGAQLREGEAVHRLVAGVYGSGGGLLAVTNRRVLLLRDGRSGQASEGFPFERLTAVRWVDGPARGTIAVSDAYSTAELTQVEPVEGAEVVGFIRSALPRDVRDELAGSDGGELFTHGAPVLAAAGSAGSAATRSGRYAVPMKLRTPRDAPLGSADGPADEPADEPAVPEQKTKFRRSRRTAATNPTAAVGATGQHALDDRTAALPSGAVPVSNGVAGHGATTVGHRPPPPVPEQTSAPRSEPDATGGRSYSRTVGVRRVAHTGGVSSSFPGEVPVSMLAEETAAIRAMPHPEQYDGSDRFDRHDDSWDGGPRVPDDKPVSRPGRRKWMWIGVAAAVLTLAIGGSATWLIHRSHSTTVVNPAPAVAAKEPAGDPVVRVTKVIDGDTIEVSGPVNGLIEVVGISAPRADKEQCGASDATAFATRTLGNTDVTLIADPGQPATDRAGRRLASLRTQSGLDYAVLAAGAGMVRYYDSAPPVAQAQDIKNAQAEAEKAGRGLWGPPCNGKLSGTVNKSGGTSRSGGSQSASQSASQTSGSSEGVSTG